MAAMIATLFGAGFWPMSPAEATGIGTQVGPWTVTAVAASPGAGADEGMTTVRRGSRTYLLARGHGSVPADLRRDGWVHVGDPSSWRGYVLDAYQGTKSARSVLFSLTDPQGRRTDRSHRLVPGELYNNSFTALSPDGQWFVAGEWGTVTRLLVFATPVLNRHAPRSGDLPLAATLHLDRPVRNVQGCAFADATTLICSTNDRGDTLFPTSRQLLSVHLAHALDGRPVSGSVTYLGAAPTPPGPPFSPAGEVEGVDVNEDTVRVSVNAPSPSGDETYTYSLQLTRDAAAPRLGAGPSPGR